jgi:hypothetical protein
MDDIRFLGTSIVHIDNHPVYSKYTRGDWVLVYLNTNPGHSVEKQRAEIGKILHGGKLTVTASNWSDGTQVPTLRSCDETPEYIRWSTQGYRDPFDLT